MRRSVGDRVAALLPIGLLVAACAPPTPARAPATFADEGRVVHVDMSEFAFAPPRLVLQAGETVTLVLTNVGKLEHEFMAGSDPMIGMGYRSDWLSKAKAKGAEAGSAEHMGLMVRVPAGATAKLVLSVPAQNGEIEFGCFAEGHYEGGMHGLLVVVGAARDGASPGPSDRAGGGPPTQTADPEGMEAH